MFWGRTLKQGETLSLSKEAENKSELHLSHVSLNPASKPGSTTVFINTGDKKFALVTLEKEKRDFQMVDLYFRTNTNTSFSVMGPGEVNLLGFFEPSDDFSAPAANKGDSEEDSEEEVPQGAVEEDSEEDEEDEDNEEEDTPKPAPKTAQKPAKVQEDDDDSDEDESSDEEEPKPVSKPVQKVPQPVQKPKPAVLQPQKKQKLSEGQPKAVSKPQGAKKPDKN